jgi:ASC-1-like (ASCH) protein
MNHELKIESCFYRAVKSGDKNFEVRFNDRGFQKGDTITLICVVNGSYTSDDPIVKEITYVLNEYGLKDGYVCLGLK